MAQLGFLGLGIMGYPMARHLLEAGHEVALWTHTSAKAKELAAKGKGTACATPKEVAQRADFIFYCVGTTAMARAVSTGKAGLLEGIRPGSVTADCSTVSPKAGPSLLWWAAIKGRSIAPSRTSRRWVNVCTTAVLLVRG